MKNWDSFEKQLPSKDSIRQALPSATAGAVTFTATLALSTLGQLKLLGVSTGTVRPIPSILGITSVLAASLASHLVSVKTFDCLQKQQQQQQKQLSKFLTPSLLDRTKKQHPTSYLPVDLHWRDPSNVFHALRVCATGLLIWKCLGGRFWSISPSSYTNLGSFARPIHSIPATEAYATASQRQCIEKLGRRYGCHTCGSRRILFQSSSSSSSQGVQFHADHMPPQIVAKQMNQQFLRKFFGRTVQQRFYPQCVTCSNIQGGLLARAKNEMNKKTSMSFLKPNYNFASAGGGRDAYFHGMRFRIPHLTGFFLGAITTANADAQDIVGNGGGNRRRFYQIQKRIHSVFHQLSTMGS